MRRCLFNRQVYQTFSASFIRNLKQRTHSRRLIDNTLQEHMIIRAFSWSDPDLGSGSWHCRSFVRESRLSGNLAGNKVKAAMLFLTTSCKLIEQDEKNWTRLNNYFIIHILQILNLNANRLLITTISLDFSLIITWFLNCKVFQVTSSIAMNDCPSLV